MSIGRLSNYFQAVAAKRLTAVEIDRVRSNQHEFQGVASFRAIFGTNTLPPMSTKFLYVDDDEENVIRDDGTLKWYNARQADPHRNEYHFYYTRNQVVPQAKTGDLLVIAQRSSGDLLAIIAKTGSNIERQLIWLFRLSDVNAGGITREIEDENDPETGFAERLVLQALEIEPEERADDFLDALTERFGNGFPSGKVFSEFARSTLPELDPASAPDHMILEYMNREELLFRTLERRLLDLRLQEPFNDTDDFIDFSLSVLNRRKARAGQALENHVQFIFEKGNVRFSRGEITENRSKPDFVLPGIAEYHDESFPADRLTMLGVKSTCKDRWRQVLTEAGRIPKKHLLTLEPSISSAQTDEMAAHKLQLVVPEPIQSTYTNDQRQWLMSFTDFIGLALHRQQ